MRKILEIYPNERISKPIQIITCWKDTKVIFDKFKKYMKAYNLTLNNKSDYSSDSLILILMDFALTKDNSIYKDEIEYIRDCIEKEER